MFSESFSKRYKYQPGNSVHSSDQEAEHMAEDQEEFEEIQFPPSLPSCLTENVVNCSQRPGVPLDEKTFAKMFDSDGRLVNEHQLRQMTFAGGVEPRIRRRVWSFLFGVYPFNSTTREREAIQSDHQAKYIAMCERWPKFLEENYIDEPNNPAEEKLLSPNYLRDVPQHCDISAYAAPPSPSSDLNIPFKMMKLQADIHAGQQKFDLKSLVTSIQIIDKDVPRTDRNLTFFSGSTNPHLRVIRNILATFAAFNPHIGYAQGMNDILARFILVLQSEVDAYWCFSHFMERMKSDFIEDGVLNKLHDIRELVLEIDPDLLQYLAEVHIDDMTFCHRWMLLCFKREFTFEDSLRCFEMLCSHHLEQNSMQAQLKREQERQKEFLQTRGNSRLPEAIVNHNLTFDVFMCVAILLKYRVDLFQCEDSAAVFGFISSLTMKLDLDDIMRRAETLFYQYCSKSVQVHDFEVVEVPISPERK